MNETAWCQKHRKIEEVVRATEAPYSAQPLKKVRLPAAGGEPGRSAVVYCTAVFTCGEQRNLVTTKERFGRMRAG